MNLEFPDGIIFKPYFVVGSLSIKRQEFIAWLESKDTEWINLDMKISKENKPYVSVYAKKATQEQAPKEMAEAFDSEDNYIPEGEMIGE